MQNPSQIRMLQPIQMVQYDKDESFRCSSPYSMATNTSTNPGSPNSSSRSRSPIIPPSRFQTPSPVTSAMPPPISLTNPHLNACNNGDVGIKTIIRAPIPHFLKAKQITFEDEFSPTSIDIYKNKCAQQERQISQLKGELSSLKQTQSKIDELLSEVDKVNTLLEEKFEESEHWKARCQDLEQNTNDFMKIGAENEQLLSCLMEKQSTINALTVQVASLQRSQDHLCSNIEQKNALLASINANLQEQRRIADDTEIKKNQKKTAEENQEKELLLIGKRLEESEKEKAKLVQRCSENEISFGKQLIEVQTELKVKLATSEIDRDKLQKYLMEMESEMQSTRGQLEIAKGQIEGLNKEIKNSINNKNSTSIEMAEDQKRLKAENELLVNLVKVHSTETERLKLQLIEIESMKTQNENRAKEIESSLRQRNLTCLQELEASRNQVLQCNQTVQDINSIYVENSQLKLRIAEKEQEIEEFQQRQETSKIEVQEQQINLTNQMEMMKTTTALESELLKANSEIGMKDEKLKELESELNRCLEEVQKKQEESIRIVEQKEYVERQIEESQKIIEELETSRDQIQVQLEKKVIEGNDLKEQIVKLNQERIEWEVQKTYFEKKEVDASTMSLQFEGERIAWNAELERLQISLNSALEEIQKLKDSKEQYDEEYTKEMESLSFLVPYLNEQIQKKDQIILEQKRIIDRFAIEQSKYESVEREVVLLRYEAEELQNQCEQLGHSYETEKAKHQYKSELILSYEMEIKSLRDDLNQCHCLISEKDTTITLLHNALSELQIQTTESAVTGLAQNERMQFISEELQKLKYTVTQRVSYIEELDNEYLRNSSLLSQQHSTFDTKIAQLREKYSKAKKEIKKAQVKLAQKNQQLDQMRIQLLEIKQKLDLSTLVSEKVKLQDIEIDSLKKEREYLVNQNDAIKYKYTEFSHLAIKVNDLQYQLVLARALIEAKSIQLNQEAPPCNKMQKDSHKN